MIFGESKWLGPGDHQGNLRVDDLRRQYRLHLPQSYDSRQPAPLVLAFHGRLGTGKHMEKLTGLSNLADQRGFMVAYPNGVGRSWNAGHGTGHAEAQGVDDVKFTAMLIESLGQTLNLDTGGCMPPVFPMVRYLLTAWRANSLKRLPPLPQWQEPWRQL